jgi:hypothetical protein
MVAETKRLATAVAGSGESRWESSCRERGRGHSAEHDFDGVAASKYTLSCVVCNETIADCRGQPNHIEFNEIDSEGPPQSLYEQCSGWFAQSPPPY